jgi:hypothetical protein
MPFNNPENDLQTKFNITHSLYRVVVENAFGRFKNRFSSLKELNVKKISTAVQLTECCIILHNFLETNNDNWDELDILDDDNNNNDDDKSNDLNNFNENMLKRAGERKRNQIIDQLQ